MNKVAQLSSIPQSAFTEVTENPVQTQSPGSNGTGSISEQEALKGAEHTKITPLSVTPGQTPGNAPGITSNTSFPGQSVSLGQMIDGKLAIELMDALVPALLVAALHMVNLDMKKSELQLTESEKKTIVPIFHECLKTINLNFNNPWILLSVTISVIYGSKVAEKGIVKWIDNKNEQERLKEAEEKIQPATTAQTVTPSTVQHTAPVQQTQQVKRASTEAELFEQIIAETFLEKGFEPVKLKFANKDISAMVAKRRVSRKEAVRMLTLQYIRNKNK